MCLDFAIVLKSTNLGKELKLHTKPEYIAGLGYIELI